MGLGRVFDERENGVGVGQRSGNRHWGSHWGLRCMGVEWERSREMVWLVR